MIHKLLEIFLDLALGPQRLTSLDVQEAECIDVAQSVEELRLGEGNFRVIRGLPERDTGLQGKGVSSQLLTITRQDFSLTTWVATHWIGTTLKTSLTISNPLLLPPTSLYDSLAIRALVLS